MKWSTFKTWVALICITSMVSSSITLKGDQGKGPQNLSPISPLLATPVSGKISLAGLLPLNGVLTPLPSIPSMIEEEMNLNQAIDLDNLNFDSIELKQIKGNKFNVQIEGKEHSATLYGSFLMIDQMKLSETGKFVMEAIDLEAKEIVTLRNLGKMLVSMKTFNFDAGSLFRAWDFETQQEVALLQPHHSQTKEKFNYLILKDPIGTDKHGNTLFRAINRKTGDETKLIETNDFLIEQSELKAGLFQVPAWNKRTQEETLISRFVTPVKGVLKEFFILQVLGQGGMGKVEKAWDPQEQKYVAIKQLLEGVEANKEMVARFQREGNLMQQLNHENIISVTATGTFPNNFYIMDFIEGKPVDEVLKKGNLNLAQAVEITSQVSAGLSYVHNFEADGQNLGIVHRDIKPQNLFLTHEGNVLLLDFGISHVSNNTQLTKTGNIMGTPHYMSPEQVNPVEGIEIDYRTDIYAVGILLYVMLVGKSPFPNSRRITKLLEIKSLDYAHEEYLYKGMLEKELGKQSKVLEQLEQIILKATAFDAENRYQSMDKMLQDLKQLKVTHTVLKKKTKLIREKTITAELVTEQHPRPVIQVAFNNQETASNFDIHKDPLADTVLEEQVKEALNIPATLIYFETAM